MFTTSSSAPVPIMSRWDPINYTLASFEDPSLTVRLLAMEAQYYSLMSPPVWAQSEEGETKRNLRNITEERWYREEVLKIMVRGVEEMQERNLKTAGNANASHSDSEAESSAAETVDVENLNHDGDEKVLEVQATELGLEVLSIKTEV